MTRAGECGVIFMSPWFLPSERNRGIMPQRLSGIHRRAIFEGDGLDALSPGLQAAAAVVVRLVVPFAG
jgi:hypothetical protein